jgi:hypothetical protein
VAGGRPQEEFSARFTQTQGYHFRGSETVCSLGQSLPHPEWISIPMDTSDDFKSVSNALLIDSRVFLLARG